MRSWFRFLAAAALTAAGLAHGAATTAAMEVERLAVDAPASTLPEGAPAERGTRATGSEVQVVLPYRTAGTWVRITPTVLPSEPRLVVNGMAASTVTLVLPGGERIERAKVRPSGEPGASLLALVFPLPEGLAPGAPLLLHFSDRHHTMMDLRLLSAADWRARERAAMGFAFAIYGAIVAFIIIAATYWAILRDRMFADHALYLATLLGFLAGSSGVLYVLGLYAQWGLVTAAIAFAVGFGTRFIDVAQWWPRVARALDLLRMALLACAVLVAITPAPLPWWGLAVTGILIAVNITLVTLGVMVALKGNRYAGYFLVGWVPLTVCTTLRALQATGLVEIRYDVAAFYALGSIWEALVLTAGIADRALSFRRERDIARHLAEHDGLTGVLNRRASEGHLRELVRRSRDGQGSLAVLFLDIDHFKAINDRYGHAAGDTCLAAIARRFAAQLRSGDVLGRWGGEEFVALLPGATRETVHGTGERIRRAVEAEPVMIDGHSIPITVSIGLAVFDPQVENEDELLQRADGALYRAKSRGRNRVEELAPA